MINLEAFSSSVLTCVRAAGVIALSAPPPQPPRGPPCVPDPPAPGPRDTSAQAFESLWAKRPQRTGCRRSCKGRHCPSERTTPRTGGAHPEPGLGAQPATAPQCQWWGPAAPGQPETVHPRRRPEPGGRAPRRFPAGGRALPPARWVAPGQAESAWRTPLALAIALGQRAQGGTGPLRAAVPAAVARWASGALVPAGQPPCAGRA